MGAGLTKILLVDTNSIYSRAYYTNPLTFFSMTNTVMRENQPDGVIFTFDAAYEQSWRKALYPDYKATRPYDAVKLIQLRLLYKSLAAANFAVWAVPGFEGDDLLDTLAGLHKRVYNNDVLIFSGDKDILALVRYDAQVVYPGRNFRQDHFIVGSGAKVREMTGATPEEMLYYKALMGDSGDNVPGIPGVGPKRARIILEWAYDRGGDDLVGVIKKHPWVAQDAHQFDVCLELVGFRKPACKAPSPAFKGDLAKAERLFAKHLTTVT